MLPMFILFANSSLILPDVKPFATHRASIWLIAKVAQCGGAKSSESVTASPL
jgi:hypothetical protein